MNGPANLFQAPLTPPRTRCLLGDHREEAGEKRARSKRPHGYTWYDPNGNLTLQTDAAGQSTSFVYDELDRRISKVYPDGAEETYAYDENGNRTSRTDPNGRAFTSEYDELDRLERIDFPATSPGAITERTIQYDHNNNVTRVEETFGVQTFTTVRTYDDFDRLDTITDRFGERIVYGYDANGNRTSVQGGGVNATYLYDELNRMTSVSSDVGVTTYDYFQNSRLKEVQYPNGATASYTWDESNRVREITNQVNGALVSRFAYEYL